MRIRAGLGPPPIDDPTALTIGNFDGVHLGHQEVIAQTLRAARDLGGPAALLTFDPHPRRVHDPDHAPAQLATPEERLERVAELGIDIAFVVPYTRELSEWSANRFMREVEAAVELRHLVVGYDISVGHARSGTAAWLQRRGREQGYQVTVVPPVAPHGAAPVHSSDVRRHIVAGEVADAARLLGHPYTLRGPVVAGDRIGRTLGFPTANLALPADKLLPGAGIYAGWARDLTTDRVRRPAAISIGNRPTFEGTELRVEAYLLDFDGELYDHLLELELVARLRGELRFQRVEDLIAAMGQDVAETRRLLDATQA